MDFKIVANLHESKDSVTSKALDPKTGQFFLIKAFSELFFSWREILSIPEIKAHRLIDHPAISKLLEVVNQDNQIFLVYEFPGMTLNQFYKRAKERNSRVFESQIKRIGREVLGAIEATHKKGFIHRNIKPESVFIAKDHSVKLSDFGKAREIKMRQKYTDYVSKRWYRAPEMLLHCVWYTPAVDMWAFGCLLAELFLLEPFFQGDSEMDQLYKIINVLGTPNKNDWPQAIQLAESIGFVYPEAKKRRFSSIFKGASEEFISLMEGLICYDPSRRLKARDALAHPFFLEKESSKAKPGIKEAKNAFLEEKKPKVFEPVSKPKRKQVKNERPAEMDEDHEADYFLPPMRKDVGKFGVKRDLFPEGIGLGFGGGGGRDEIVLPPLWNNVSKGNLSKSMDTKAIQKFGSLLRNSEHFPRKKPY